MESVTKAWTAALSRGPGYEPQPRGRHFSSGRVNGYFLDLTKKARLPIPRASERQPAGLAQLALAYRDLELDGDPTAAHGFDECCALLIERAEIDGEGLLWPYTLDVKKYGLGRPWYSAMAQGQIASVFVRAAQRDGSDHYAELARRAIEPICRPRSRLVTYTDRGPVLEEVVTTPASHVLNGWIYASWGLWDVATALGDKGAAQLLEATVECLRLSVPLYDTGWWTLYSLYPHRTRDLAKPFYHRLHATQVGILYELFALKEFDDVSVRWRAYDRRLNRAAAVGHKAMFVALGR